MRCKCSKLPDAFYLEDAPRGFERNLVREATGDWMWLGLCPNCQSLWAIDEWDKYIPQVVSRVDNRDNWDKSVTAEKRKQLLLESRGGFSNKECVWVDCHEKAVKGVAFCLNHLWKTGARK
jgi:hypothetical protein